MLEQHASLKVENNNLAEANKNLENKLSKFEASNEALQKLVTERESADSMPTPVEPVSPRFFRPALGQ